MRTSPDRFSKCHTLFRGADDVLRNVEVYTYEAHNGLYDLLIIDGLKFVRVDMGQLSNMIDAWKPHHYKIEQHFNLSP